MADALHHGFARPILVLGALYVIYRVFIWIKTPTSNFPVVGSPGDSDFSDAALEGFERYPDTPFILPSNPRVVVLPLSMYMEVKNHPKVHNNLERQTRFMTRWTHADPELPELFPVIRKDMAKNMSALVPLIQDETKYAFGELNLTTEWKTITIQSTVQRMIALITSRAFVGEPVCRNEEWLELAAGYTTALGHVQDDYNSLHPYAAKFMAPFLKSVRTARQFVTRAEPILSALVTSVLLDKERTTAPLEAGDPGALISWLLNYIPEEDRTTRRISMDQLVLAVAAIHNTTNTTAFALMNLLEHPEYIDDMRAELHEELAREADQNGNPPKFLTKTAFANMRKLDSFLKESMRYSGVFTVNPLYLTTANATFSNGVQLAKGTCIGFSTRGVSMSPTNPTLGATMNAEADNPGPDTFDGYRFEKLRNIPGHEAKHQAVTTGLDSIVWGHGPHACPGRFFAIYEIKSILMEILLNYDIRSTSKVKRPQAQRVGLISNPDPLATLEIRMRSF